MKRRLRFVVCFIFISISYCLGVEVFDTANFDFGDVNSVFDKYKIIAFNDNNHSDISYRKFFFDFIEKYLDDKIKLGLDKVNIGIVLEMPHALLADCLNYIEDSSHYEWSFYDGNYDIKRSDRSPPKYWVYNYLRLKYLKEKYKNTNINIQIMFPDIDYMQDNAAMSKIDNIIEKKKKREAYISSNVLSMKRSDKIFELYGDLHHEKSIRAYSASYPSYLYTVMSEIKEGAVIADIRIRHEDAEVKLYDYETESVLLRKYISVNKVYEADAMIQNCYPPVELPFSLSLTRNAKGLSKQKSKRNKEAPIEGAHLSVFEYSDRNFKPVMFRTYFNRMFDGMKKIAIANTKKFAGSYHAYREYSLSLYVISNINRKTFDLMNRDKGVEAVFESIREDAYIKQLISFLWYGTNEEKEFAYKELKSVTGKSYTAIKEWLEWYCLERFYDDYFKKS